MVLLVHYQLKNKENSVINKLKNKNAVIISFLQGENLSTVNAEHCRELGKKLQNLQILQKL